MKLIVHFTSGRTLTSRSMTAAEIGVLRDQLLLSADGAFLFDAERQQVLVSWSTVEYLLVVNEGGQSTDVSDPRPPTPSPRPPDPVPVEPPRPVVGPRAAADEGP